MTNTTTQNDPATEVKAGVNLLLADRLILLAALRELGSELEASSVRMTMFNGLDATEFIRQTIAHVLGR